MDAPFDRGDVDRASLDATERLRARLSSRPAPPPPRPGRSFLPWAVAGGLFVFTAGMIANPWFEAGVRNKLPFSAAITAKPPETAEIAQLRDRLARLESPSMAPIPAERLAATEARIANNGELISREADRIDRLTAELATLNATLQSDRARTEAATIAATAAADRAQAMLTLVLVRRAVDTGRPFGALDGALRRSFEARYPDAVRTIAALGMAPVSIASLRRDFNALRPAIGARPAADQRQSWWDSLTTTISNAISSPAPGAPQPPPEAASAALARGDYLAAANHLRRLPAPRPPALANWLAAADRLNAGNQALAVLESASVLTPPVIAAPLAAPTAALAPTAAPPAPTAAPAAAGGGSGTASVVVGAVRRALDLRGVLNGIIS